jgi:aspartate racemase
MRLVGVLGGLSWESTAIYYRLMNREVSARLSGLHSARILLHSFDFAPIAELQNRDDWSAIGDSLAMAASELERAGAEVILLATNTLHFVAPAIESVIGVPFLHIVDPTGRALQARGIRRAGFLGTKYSMELPFWRTRLADKFGVEMIIPDATARSVVHRVIYEELCRGKIEDSSRQAYIKVIEQLRDAGAEALILGCTEIGLLIDQKNSPLPLFDTSVLHASAAVELSLADEECGHAISHAAGDFVSI